MLFCGDIPVEIRYVELFNIPILYLVYKLY